MFSKDRSQVLFAKRKGEQDYDGVFSFIGGKTEITDESLLAGLKREKDEEIGPGARVKICWNKSCYQVLYRKKDGNSMVLPHHVALFEGGRITLNPDEYAEYQWVSVADIPTFEPKIGTSTDAVTEAMRLLEILKEEDFVKI